MIVFNLQCKDGHGFEAWFKDAAAYDSQRRARKVACPVCGLTKVDKMPAAPRISKGTGRDADASGKGSDDGKARAADYLRAMEKLQRHVEENCDYVGDKFAEEARKIHYGEVEERGIYGQATKEEAKELSDEGVPFAAIPKRRHKDA
jgi:hypothetical protein